MTLSFIIPAHNEELLLARTLRSIRDSARPLGAPYELIVADDASTDLTAAIAKEHGASVVPVDRRQIAAVRNVGAKTASGEYLIFVDADTVISPETVQAAVSALAGGAVGGGCAVRFDGKLPLYGRVIEATAAPFDSALGLAAGCFVFCRRDAFQAVGGFDETLFGGEEATLSWELRKRGRFVILKEAVVTSGRKLRTYSAMELARIFVRVVLSGPSSLRRRDGLEVWYGERRPDPGTP